MFASGVALWLVYGLVINSMPLIVTNALTLVFALSILVMKIREVHAAALVDDGGLQQLSQLHQQIHAVL